MTQQIGVVGLAVMGKNLAWNIESRGYSVSVFNRSSEKTDEMVKESEGKNIHPTYSMEEFVNSLEKPRKILLMVKAGTATDATIDTLLPLLDDDDILKSEYTTDGLHISDAVYKKITSILKKYIEE